MKWLKEIKVKPNEQAKMVVIHFIASNLINSNSK